MIKLFVHIIESPSANDLFNNMTEGVLLKEGLHIAGLSVPISWQ